MKRLLLPAALIIIVIGFLFAGQSDYEEAVRQQAEYCQMVDAGTWPDYNGNYAEVCTD